MLKNQHLDFLEDEKGLSIQIKWYDSSIYGLLFFTLFWNGAIYWILKTMYEQNDMPIVFYLFPIFHIATGIFLIYYISSLFLNKTYIEINDSTLRRYNDPFPWYKSNLHIELEEIKEFYIKEKKVNSKNSKGITFHLMIKLISGKEILLEKIGNISGEELISIKDRLVEFTKN